MSEQVTITTITANTPVNIYYCDSDGNNCIYVSSVSSFPYTFDVPISYSANDFIVKIVDSNSCVDTKTIYIT